LALFAFAGADAAAFPAAGARRADFFFPPQWVFTLLRGVLFPVRRL
jgi:hypothetical protein